MLNNQGRFINNIMGNSKGALKIDKAIKCNDNGLIEIVDHPNQVKEEIRKGMEIWHSDKPSVQDNIINWRKELEPEDKIDPEIYEGLMDKVSDEEWDQGIKEIPLGKAPGESGLSGEIIKNLKTKGRAWVRRLADLVITKRVIPLQFKCGVICPIPKKDDWGGINSFKSEFF